MAVCRAGDRLRVGEKWCLKTLYSEQQDGRREATKFVSVGRSDFSSEYTALLPALRRVA